MSSILVKLWFSFLWFTLNLIHFGYSVYEYFTLQWLFFARKLKRVLNLAIFDSHVFVTEFVRQLEKCPSHFVVIVGQDELSLQDFSNLVIWCLAAKISFLTFYDHSGYLKSKEHFYYEYLLEKKKLDPKCLKFNLSNAKEKNGVLNKIHVNIVSLEDGKPVFVDVAKSISENVTSNKLKYTEINERLVASELHKFSRLPEPDLAVVSGRVFGTFGFLPWHIRVTEFVHIKSLKDVEVSEFNQILMSYSKCSQRFGK